MRKVKKTLTADEIGVHFTAGTITKNGRRFASVAIHFTDEDGEETVVEFSEDVMGQAPSGRRNQNLANLFKKVCKEAGIDHSMDEPE